ncbi:MAG: undecaprenyl diphosphate synthase [Thermotogota bacterium]|nr:undecaprenyl diphosphate synthase [Thermotogota bacterium]MDK2865680.1 undecaprenyl diphosphate synthase [Thermotogota bacterium]
MKLTVPRHVGIIMDGNGRWARHRGLPRVEGHRRGARVAEDVIYWARDLGIEYLTLFTFSTENWARPRREIEFLFEMLKRRITEKKEELVSEGVKVVFAGRLEDLPEDLYNACIDLMEATKENRRITVISALNYGGRSEILDAVRRIIKEKLEHVDEEIFRRFLYVPDLPDLDLIIRTSGEYRLSNFMLWHSAYAELLIIDKYWPEFTKEDLIFAIEEYSRRERRFGKVQA